MATFGERLRGLRLCRGDSQQRVSYEAGISPCMISLYEQGEKLPGLYVAMRLADYFGCSLDYLTGRKDVFEVV